MPRSYYKPSDLDEPILKGKSLGFSIEEVAAALGVPVGLVASRFEAAMTPKKLPAVVTQAKETAATERDPRRIAWERARRGARVTLSESQEIGGVFPTLNTKHGFPARLPDDDLTPQANQRTV